MFSVFYNALFKKKDFENFIKHTEYEYLTLDQAKTCKEYLNDFDHMCSREFRNNVWQV